MVAVQNLQQNFPAHHSLVHHHMAMDMNSPDLEALRILVFLVEHIPDLTNLGIEYRLAFEDKHRHSIAVVLDNRVSLALCLATMELVRQVADRPVELVRHFADRPVELRDNNKIMYILCLTSKLS